jgi:ubiquinone/menaquinone biosynthesis C-methylase UbiE
MQRESDPSAPSTHRHFIPAAGADWLLPFYDPLNRLLLREEHTRGRLVAEAAIAPGARVLDLGCGTGALSVMILERHPEARVSALDPDPLALERARRKAERAGLAIDFRQGFGDALPWPDASFDRVLSSLVLHHLTADEKRSTLAEARRVLAPGGSLHVLDFGAPRTRVDRWLTFFVHHGGRIEDNLAGRLPGFMAAAGFRDARETGRARTAFGSLSLYAASRA